MEPASGFYEVLWSGSAMVYKEKVYKTTAVQR